MMQENSLTARATRLDNTRSFMLIEVLGKIGADLRSAIGWEMRCDVGVRGSTLLPDWCYSTEYGVQFDCTVGS